MPLALRAAALVFAARAAFPQAPAAAPATPSFEVAAIKPAVLPTGPQLRSGQVHIGMRVNAARVDIGNFSLSDLVRVAFRVKAWQISGPSWMSSERFDIQATLPQGATEAQVPEMLQVLLAERFGLVSHRENKEHPVYALVVGKNGHKLKESPPDEPAAPASDAPSRVVTLGVGNDQVRVTGRPDSAGGLVLSGGQAGTTRVTMGPGGTLHLEASKMALSGLADMLSRFVDRPVIDMTGLKGTWQVALDLSMEDLRSMARSAGLRMAGAGPVAGPEGARQPADAASDPSGATIFSALGQAGLKLEPRKMPVETIVIDRLEKSPTEN